jgi:site-specific DNA-methyltransferase (cytosine-N4-specific)
LIDLMLGDCRDLLKTLPDGSVDAVITDPPYAEIDRPYGRLTEAEWHALMNAVVAECRRILKPTGSAVFVLQPNSEKVGRMRPWLWEFMAKWTREWNMVQDAWWWNYGALPTEMANHQGGMRASLKACVWLGNPDCYRDQAAVFLEPSEITKKHKHIDRHELVRRVGTSKSTRASTLLGAWKKRGGVTPYNVLVCSNGGSKNPNVGHGAATPHEVADWWVRYISPPGGVVLDPFMGSGTIPLAALARGRSVIGIEKEADYFAIAQSRLAEAQASAPLFAPSQ